MDTDATNVIHLAIFIVNNSSYVYYFAKLIRMSQTSSNNLSAKLSHSDTFVIYHASCCIYKHLCRKSFYIKVYF